MTAADSGLEHFAREWHGLRRPALDSGWRRFGGSGRPYPLQRDSLHELVRNDVGAVANQIAAAWPVIVGLAASVRWCSSPCR